MTVDISAPMGVSGEGFNVLTIYPNATAVIKGGTYDASNIVALGSDIYAVVPMVSLSMMMPRQRCAMPNSSKVEWTFLKGHCPPGKEPSTSPQEPHSTLRVV
jgi:hypothetical protein